MKTSLGRRFPLYESLAIVAAIVVLALAGLVGARNWPKVLRVVAAFVTYGGILVLVVRRFRAAGRWWPFGVAGLAAGLVSGLVRTQTTAVLVCVQGAGGVLFGTAHWVGALVAGWIRADRAD
jgi:hypothetical protein